MEWPNAAGKPLHKLVDDLAGTVCGTVIDWNHQHLVFRILHRHQGAENVGDHLFFVVGSHEYRDGRPVGRVDVDIRMSLETEEAVQREKVVAGGIRADDEKNRVENIKKLAQTQPEHGVRIG